MSNSGAGWRRVLAAAGALLLAGASQPPRLLGIEHVPVAVRDLEAAATRFRALGFTLKPGRAHANGIRNVHAKFADGSYLELITAPAARDPLTWQYRAFLAQGDGPAFVALYVSALSGLSAIMAPLGGQGSDDDVEFPDGPLSAFFFGTRSRSPTDRPEHYRHANTARSLERVWLASDDAAIVAMLGRLGARLRPGRACLPRCGQVEMATLAAGEIVLLDRRRQRVPGRPIVGVTIGVTSLAATRRALRAGGVTAVASGRSLFVPPTAANGLWIEFREAGAQAASSAASSP